jgi:hypothetical protein
LSHIFLGVLLHVCCHLSEPIEGPPHIGFMTQPDQVLLSMKYYDRYVLRKSQIMMSKISKGNTLIVLDLPVLPIYSHEGI